MLQFLQLHCLEANWALSGGGAVAGTTKQTMVLPDTPVSVMVATAFPAAGMPITGNVAVAKQETSGAVHDWEGVGPNMVDHVSYGHPLRGGPTEFQAYGQVIEVGHLKFDSPATSSDGQGLPGVLFGKY
ncbi:hypothetical protein E2C01_085393 [Portunus trituberculatus]|uniref:Uncharacterized protein n=1 Tax=Portunus trituberculatus TaxID=210409 RepID=A0A5B7J8R5_PORTR|nr:hypothetical protein [Portunus trituberculatus]